MMIELKLEVNEVEAVVAGLRKLPMELIEELVMKIKMQAIPQIQAQQTQASTDPTISAAEEVAPTE